MRCSNRPEWARSQRYRPSPSPVTHPSRKDTVECLSGEKKQEMDAFLATYYRFVDKFTYRDFFYEAVQPSVLMRK